MPDYDHPFVKQLSRNDIGATGGHQGGPVIPIELRPYLPPLPDPAAKPTEETYITLDLFDGGTPIGSVVSRWHYQTWAQTRPRETRLTRGVTRLTGTASAGDVISFEREMESTHRFKATLIRAGTAEHALVLAPLGGERWGTPFGMPIAAAQEIAAQAAEIDVDQAGAFSLHNGRPVVPTKRLFRDAAFARSVRVVYDQRCAACGEGYLVPVDQPDHLPPCEPQAAHIVPIRLGGPDDVRNGLCLCRAHHWAFDYGLIYVNERDLWQVVDASKRENRNATLNDIDGTPLYVPMNPSLRAHADALRWHREHMVLAI